MIEDSLTIYKLIVLHMLNRVEFPLTRAKIGDFILGNEYTNFITLQQVFSELTDAGFITTKVISNRTLLSLTEEGADTLQFFRERLGEDLKNDIDDYLRSNEYEIRNEASVIGDYYKSVTGEFEAHLIAMEHDIKLVDITLSVPTKEMASDICESWMKKNQQIYQYLVSELFS